jgi:hypothetical protein
MNQVDFSYLVGACEESALVDVRGSAKSMGPNGWNPNPT